MRDLNNNLTTSGKSSTNIQPKKTKSFGYQILGFGAGGGFTGMTATGGAVTYDGAYTIHTFTGTSALCVTALSPDAAANVVEYLIVGGGGVGGNTPGPQPCTGGGGAGGFRESPGSTAGCYSVSPLGVSPAAAIPVTCSPGTYPVTIGASANDSVFGGLTSARGGAGGPCPRGAGSPGGSGGGGGGSGGGGTVGIGNDPPVAPPQGSDSGGPLDFGGGGGGAAGVGSHTGGAGYAPGIGGPCVTTYRSGGGGNGHADTSSQPQCATSGRVSNAESGAANTGSGGGAANSPGYGPPNKGPAGAGGSGVVILRYRSS